MHEALFELGEQGADFEGDEEACDTASDSDANFDSESRGFPARSSQALCQLAPFMSYCDF